MTYRYKEYNYGSLSIQAAKDFEDFSLRTIIHNKQKKNKKSKPQLAVLSPKQYEYIQNANRYFNIYCGATGAGKTYLSRFLFRKRVMEAEGVGMMVIVGFSRDSVVRNVIIPLRKFWGKKEVGSVRGGNKVTIFGREFHIFGAGNRKGADTMQGPNWEYAYCDELTTYNKEAFDMILSRLRVGKAMMDAACNPKHPEHFIKEWIDDNIKKNKNNPQLYYLHTTIFDAKLHEDPKKNMEAIAKLYYSKAGVYRRRFMYGEWARAEGLIHRTLSENENILDINKKDIPVIDKLVVGLDYGVNSGQHAIVATGLNVTNGNVYVLKSVRLDAKVVSLSKLPAVVYRFTQEVEHEWGYPIDYIWADAASPEKTDLVEGYFKDMGRKIRFKNSLKKTVAARIDLVDLLINTGRLFLTEDCLSLKHALLSAAWDPKHPDGDVRLDEHGVDVDSLDAFEYTLTPDYDFLMTSYNYTNSNIHSQAV